MNVENAPSGECSFEKLDYLLDVNEFLVFLTEGKIDEKKYNELLSRLHIGQDERKKVIRHQFDELLPSNDFTFDDLFSEEGGSVENKCDIIVEENLKLMEMLK
jgi:hypothetical protein